MQSKFIKYFNYTLLITVLFLVGASVLFTSCDDDDDDGYGNNVLFESYGPMPVARGAELRFVGRNMDKVSAIILPDNIEIAEFGTKTSELVTITVPQNAVEGNVIVKTPQGDITTKTPLSFSEPISIASFSPSTVKAGMELTITGDYLNLVKEVIFTDLVSVGDTAFISQSRENLKLLIPAMAQTGKFSVSNGAEDPIIVFSEESLIVKLPTFSTIMPNPIKAGKTLTITGTDLDLVKTIILGGNIEITSFVSQSETEITINVPADTKDGKVTLIPASAVNVESELELILVVPIVSVTPTTVKNGNEITVTGTDLDLIDQIIFGGDKQGTIVSTDSTIQMVVSVPDDAITGEVIFMTKAEKQVSGGTLTLVDPVFTSFSPATAKANTNIIIEGTNLDLVVTIVFTGGIEGVIRERSESQLTVNVPIGAKDGNITLVTKNGNQVQSAGEIAVPPNLPEITSFSESKGVPGEILTINGTNLLLIKELIFPGNITATAYGIKSDEMVEVYIPMDVAKGVGTIKIITYEGEQGFTPEIFIGGTDPIVDPALMITDCEDPDVPGSWDDHIEIGNDPAYALSGNYIHGIITALSGWQWIWGNNSFAFPSVTSADHVLKIDVRVEKPFGASNVNFQMELGGNRIDIGAFGITTPNGTTTGWITVTYDLSTFGALPATIPSGGEWGINLGSADGDIDISGLYIDNIRYEKK